MLRHLWEGLVIASVNYAEAAESLLDELRLEGTRICCQNKKLLLVVNREFSLCRSSLMPRSMAAFFPRNSVGGE